MTGAGICLTMTDQADHVTRYQYDLAGQLLSVTQAYGTTNAGTTAYTYDAAGRKVGETDPLGHTTQFIYDAVGHVLTTTNPLTHTVVYTYDPAGRRLSSTDANGHAVSSRTTFAAI